jgi:hypothetical protein
MSIALTFSPNPSPVRGGMFMSPLTGLRKSIADLSYKHCRP